jgi:hypothetical protein
MKLDHKQRQYGVAFGLGAFLIGLAITHLLSPPDLLPTEPRWKVVTWLYLNAHGVEISASHFNAFSFGTTNLLNEIDAPVLSAVPLFVVTLGGILIVDAVSYTTRFTYILENAAWLLTGYLAAGIVAFGLSEARPGLTILIAFIGTLIAAVAIGSRVIGAALGGMPFIGIASLGLVASFGLIFLIGGLALAFAIGPLVLTSIAGVCISALSIYSIRQLP